MTSREHILATMDHKETDRVPMWESYWDETIVRWENEGLPKGTDLHKYFELDPSNVSYIQWTCMFDKEVIEESDTHVVYKNEDGVTARSLKHNDAPPFWSNYPIYDRDSWERMRPKMLWNEKRINLEEARSRYDATQDQYQIYCEPCCGFERFKYIMGTEGILLAMAEDPDWVGEMIMDTSELAINGLEYMLGKGFQFDAAFITEDMGYAHNTFFSKAMFRELIMPAQKRLCDFVHARGMKMMLHSCGYVEPLLPLFIETGIDILNPMEVKAGMDLLRIKKEYADKLALWGGIDIRVFQSDDPDAIEKEIALKVPVAKQGGGYIFASDHSIPPSASLQKYEQWIKLGRKYGKY